MIQNSPNQSYEQFTIIPASIGIFTRMPRLVEDYQWYGPYPSKDAFLFDAIKTVHDRLIVDTGGTSDFERKEEYIPKVAVISLKNNPKNKPERIAVLFADIKTDQKDDIGRSIYSTLYFETGADDIMFIVQLALNFMHNLDNPISLSKILLEYFQSYLEQIHQHTSNTQKSDVNVSPLKELFVSLPECPILQERAKAIKQFSKEPWVEKYDKNKNEAFENYLVNTIPKNRGISNPGFVFVSTGRVHIEKIQEVAYDRSFSNRYDYFWVRTTSQTVKRSGKLNRPKKHEKKRKLKKIFEYIDEEAGKLLNKYRESK